ncbi:MAG TPA: hypothetical protein VF109_09085 [Mycobacteriales bacterium]
MGEVRPIPTLGGVFRDARGQGRALRVSWHAEDGMVVLSLWDGARCTGTVRVTTRDVPALMEALAAGLRPPAPFAPVGPVAPPAPVTPPGQSADPVTDPQPVAAAPVTPSGPPPDRAPRPPIR